MPHVPPVPGETLRVTRAAFPKGNLCMQIRDVLEGVCADTRFDALFTWRGRPAEAPWRLVLVMLLQVRGGAIRSSGGRGRARTHRLEVPAWSGAGRRWHQRR